MILFCKFITSFREITLNSQPYLFRIRFMFFLMCITPGQGQIILMDKILCVTESLNISITSLKFHQVISKCKGIADQKQLQDIDKYNDSIRSCTTIRDTQSLALETP